MKKRIKWTVEDAGPYGCRWMLKYRSLKAFSSGRRGTASAVDEVFYMPISCTHKK